MIQIIGTIGVSTILITLAVATLGWLFLQAWRDGRDGIGWGPFIILLGFLLFTIFMVMALSGCALPHWEPSNGHSKPPQKNDCLFTPCPWGQTCSFEDKGPFLYGRYQCKANS
jgi:hypothetical protein